MLSVRCTISGMRLLCLFALLTSSFLSSAQDNALVESFAGCYDLRILSSHPARAKKDAFLPRRFILTTRAAYPDPRNPAKRRFVVRSLDSTVHDQLLSWWSAEDSKAFEMIWSTGYVGYSVSLSKVNDEFRGVARYSTDTDISPSETLTLVARRTGCKNSETNVPEPPTR